MLTKEMLTRALVNRMMLSGGKAFTLEQELGRYQKQLVGCGDTWRQTGCTSLHQIQAGTALAKQVAEDYPGMELRFPQKLISAMQPVGNESVRTELCAATVQFSVPEKMIRQHTGADFRALLEDKWQTQTAELTQAAAKLLRKYELRTLRLFGRVPDGRPLQIRVTSEHAATEIWTLPLARCGFYPLLWDSEVSGLSLLLADTLTALLRPEIGEKFRICVTREEQAQCCLLTFCNMEEPE